MRRFLVSCALLIFGFAAHGQQEAAPVPDTGQNAAEGQDIAPPLPGGEAEILQPVEDNAPVDTPPVETPAGVEAAPEGQQPVEAAVSPGSETDAAAETATAVGEPPAAAEVSEGGQDSTGAETPATAESDGAEKLKEEGEVGQAEEPQSEEVTELQTLMNSLRIYEVSEKDKRNPYRRYRVVVEKRNKSQKGKKLGMLPLQQWDLKELELVGVIWGVKKPKAMIKDPSGKLHFVGKHGKMGLNDGYVAVIRDSEIVVVEAFNTEQGVLYQTQLMKVKR